MEGVGIIELEYSKIKCEAKTPPRRIVEILADVDG
jgi:hypothetical protein